MYVCGTVGSFGNSTCSSKQKGLLIATTKKKTEKITKEEIPPAKTNCSFSLVLSNLWEIVVYVSMCVSILVWYRVKREGKK